jgi:hypothetical protein
MVVAFGFLRCSAFGNFVTHACMFLQSTQMPSSGIYGEGVPAKLIIFVLFKVISIIKN